MRTPNASIMVVGGLGLGLLIGTLALHPRVQTPLPGALNCTAPATPMSRLELLFGTQRTGAAPVNEDEWIAFVASEITPRFPDGLTILDATGQWRGSDGVLKMERTHVLVVWHPPSPASHAAIEAIRAAYKSRFGQESVMRVDATSCVSF